MSERTYRESFSLKTDDIAGARPVLKPYQFTNKINYSNSTAGIDKSSPKPQPDPAASLTTKPVQTSKRSSLEVRDITGSKPILSNLSPRDSLDVSDITKKSYYSPQYTRPGIKKRITNPLSPEYTVTSDRNQTTTIGEISGNKPKTLVNTAKPPHNRTLNVKDIQGDPLKYSNTSTTFSTPKAKLKDLITRFYPPAQLKCLSGCTSPAKSIDFSLNSPGKSLKTSPEGSLRAVAEGKCDQKRVTKKMPLPRSPRGK